MFQHERQHDDDDDGSTRQVLVQEQAANCAKMHPCDSNASQFYIAKLFGTK
jgi:hypothetical protein